MAGRARADCGANRRGALSMLALSAMEMTFFALTRFRVATDRVSLPTAPDCELVEGSCR